VVKLVKELGFPRDVQAVKNQLVDQLDDPEGQNPAIIRSLVEAGAEIQYVGEMHHSLEDNYLQLIHNGEGIREGRMTSQIKTIIDKEWVEVFKNRMVLLTVALLPIIFTAPPIVFLNITNSGDALGSTSEMPPTFAMTCGGLTPSDCMQTSMLNEFLLLYMIMPLMITITITATALWGRKLPAAWSRSWPPLLPPKSCWQVRAWRRLSRLCWPPGFIS